MRFSLKPQSHNMNSSASQVTTAIERGKSLSLTLGAVTCACLEYVKANQRRTGSADTPDSLHWADDKSLREGLKVIVCCPGPGLMPDMGPDLTSDTRPVLMPVTSHHGFMPDTWPGCMLDTRHKTNA
ncbi:hypothetical protein PoB_000305500 [Plakobranchus ocellatus]|uniref:Uncharacterized protein n=1 Tax=Plakobranchus ocellatus TaxID=259542 RepID=A0AAV3Y0E3_9GAST|nr:hypothetical protein PoB_000305500 [Plakobranchus ocellatus]